MMTTTIKQQFYAAHLYHQKKWNSEENQKIFGACYSKFGHGHNYKWEASFEVPNATVSLAELLQATALLNLKMDHKHLNFEAPSEVLEYFTERIPTTENIALFLFESLAKERLPYPLKSLRLYEDDTIWAEVVK